jgi:acyl-coenzyme A thioesterase PaaI-like protein
MNLDFIGTLLECTPEAILEEGNLHGGVITCTADVADVFVAIHRFLEVANVIG